MLCALHTNTPVHEAVRNALTRNASAECTVCSVQCGAQDRSAEPNSTHAPSTMPSLLSLPGHLSPRPINIKAV